MNNTLVIIIYGVIIISVLGLITIMVGDYMAYRDLQRRLQKEREE